MANQWQLTTHARNVHKIEFKPEGEGWSQDVLLLSDLHWDNPACNRDLLAKHLEQAKEKNAPVLVLGDLFCCMGGRAAGRRMNSEVRPEFQVDDYFDQIVQQAAAWLEPYKDQIAVIGQGNHETKILKVQEVSLLDRLAMLMRSSGGVCRASGYSGFVRFAFKCNFNYSEVLFWHHGYGGGGATGQAQAWPRYMSMVRADIYCAGHIHSKMVKPVKMARLTSRNKVEQATIHAIRCGTDKADYKDGFGGWHVEKGQGPRPLGGYWLRFKREGKKIRREVIEAN